MYKGEWQGLGERVHAERVQMYHKESHDMGMPTPHISLDFVWAYFL